MPGADVTDYLRFLSFVLIRCCLWNLNALQTSLFQIDALDPDWCESSPRVPFSYTRFYAISALVHHLGVSTVESQNSTKQSIILKNLWSLDSKQFDLGMSKENKLDRVTPCRVPEFIFLCTKFRSLCSCLPLWAFDSRVTRPQFIAYNTRTLRFG